MLQMLARDNLRRIVVDGEPDVRARFVQEFAEEIDQFVADLDRVQRRLGKFQTAVLPDLRSAWVFQYLWVALNALLTSYHLRLAGYLVPAGNLMRQFGESVAMALLLCHPEIDSFDRLARNPAKYPVHKALNEVKGERNRELLGVDEESWREFTKIASFYHKLSHPSALAAAVTHRLDVPGAGVLGADYDPEKRAAYEREFRLGVSGCGLLYQIVEHTERILVQHQPRRASPRGK